MENSNSKSKKSSRNRNRMILERGVVGLGIVAAMNISNSSDVVSSAKPAANFRGTTTYGLFHASTLNTGTRFPTPHFLNSCNLCHKHLHGVDIFIYRGEKAFCSAECRETHITNYEHHQDNYDYYYTSPLIKPILQHKNALRPTSCTVSVSILAA